MGRIVKECVREVSLAQVSCILMYVYVAPPTPVGAWSMALGLQQRFEYYYYCRFLWEAMADQSESGPLYQVRGLEGERGGTPARSLFHPTQNE